MKGKVLIAGGTGFLGAALTQHLSSNGFQCTVLARSAAKQKQVNGVEYRACDLTEVKNLRQCINDDEFHYVVNLSGAINHSPLIDGGVDVINNHFGSTLNLLSSINRQSLRRFIQVGSSDEYGYQPAPQSETMESRPFSSYSFAKSASTELIFMLQKTENIPAVVLRPFLIYGPGQDENRIVPSIIIGCINNREVKLTAGEQLRDFCYVDDFCRAVELSIEGNNVDGKIFNIGSGVPTSIKALANLIRNQVGSGTLVFGAVPYRTGENFELFADNQAALNILGWTPNIGLHEGIKQTISYYERICGSDE